MYRIMDMTINLSEHNYEENPSAITNGYNTKSLFSVKDITSRRYVHSVGFEPTSTNTFELESNPLDRSGTNAYFLTKN